MTFGEPVINTERTNLTIENDIGSGLASIYTPSKMQGIKRQLLKLPEPIVEEEEPEVKQTKKRFDFDKFAKKREEESRKQLEKNLSASKLTHLLAKAGGSKVSGQHSVPFIKKLQKIKKPVVTIQIPEAQKTQEEDKTMKIIDSITNGRFIVKRHKKQGPV